MARFDLRIKRSAAKELARLPAADVRRILQRLRALQDDPRPPGAVKLTGRETWRIRQGDYRILYDVLDHVLVVEVIQVGHRREVCRD